MLIGNGLDRLLAARGVTVISSSSALGTLASAVAAANPWALGSERRREERSGSAWPVPANAVSSVCADFGVLDCLIAVMASPFDCVFATPTGINPSGQWLGETVISIY